jgi:predicted dehydrogenase
MALDLTSEQRELGKSNFARTTGELSRRGFMKTVVAGAAVAPVAAAAYFGYERFIKDNFKPVRTALIGAGDEGGVLVGEHHPRYLEIVAICDIRPSNYRSRIFKGEGGLRKGLNFHYGNDCDRRIKHFHDYRELLSDPSLGVEAVIIALPLHLHAPVAIDAMRAGKHVLCEKLMAWNISQCKAMIKTATETERVLAIGHQRHYSMLYAQAQEALMAGVLGDVRHIRALWHRNNTWPRVDPKTGRPIAGAFRDSWRPDIKQEDRDALEPNLDQWGYKSLEELVRWRLYQRTGGGLMAELGSHQLDACSIFLGKVQPLAVSGVGGKLFYTDDREVDDHVFATFEFPGPDYFVRDKHDKPTREVKNRNDVVVVNYSSINTNALEKYGECLMGSRGTMIVEEEQTVLLFGERDPNLREAEGPRSTAVTVTTSLAGQPVLETTATSPAVLERPGAPAGGGTSVGGVVSRGYREEMEHFAYCVRMHSQASEDDKTKWQHEVRCSGPVAMADAIIALTSNLAMKQRQRIEFDPRWFDPTSSDVPDAHVIATDHKGNSLTL